MIKEYEKQSKLLVECLSAVAKEGCFALKGGTAINFFYYDLPRLSVDIDLTYIHFEDRLSAFGKIYLALENISNHLKKLGISTKITTGEYKKIICEKDKVQIKIEPNYNMRGYVFDPVEMEVSPSVQNQFGYAKLKIISKAELFGGKICAALDRQHPRDLFDVANFLETETINEDIKNGIIVSFLSSDRNLYELLDANLKDEQKSFDKEFKGMSNKIFTYENHVETFNKLKQILAKSLDDEDKKFLLDFMSLELDLENVKIPNFNKLPAIKFKINNLEILKSNKSKFQKEYEKLEKLFEKML